MPTAHVHISCSVPTTDLHVYHNSVQGSHVGKGAHVSFCSGRIPALLMLSQICHCNDHKAILENPLQGFEPLHESMCSVGHMLGSKKFHQSLSVDMQGDTFSHKQLNCKTAPPPFLFWTYFVLC